MTKKEALAIVKSLHDTCGIRGIYSGSDKAQMDEAISVLEKNGKDKKEVDHKDELLAAADQ